MVKVKKILRDTIGVTIGSVGISQASTIPTYGRAIGTSIGAGLVLSMGDYKKGKRRK